jgi:hypothetical protein
MENGLAFLDSVFFKETTFFMQLSDFLFVALGRALFDLRLGRSSDSKTKSIDWRAGFAI